MIVTQIQEIQEVIPTSRWKDESKLLGSIADEELSVLQPALGDELLAYVQDKYDELIDKYESLTERSKPAIDDADVDDVKLIRQLQKVVILRMVSNRVASLSVSFNEGGGLNRMGTDGYDGASLDELKEIKFEYFRNSNKALDAALYILEMDARKTSSKYKTMWQKSDWYFHHHDLIFPTMSTLIPFYTVTTQDKRVAFVELLPEIRWCQNTYLLPVLGQDLIELLIKEGNDTCRKALQLIRIALGVLLTVRTSKNPPKVLEASAQQSIQTAIKFMQNHQNDLMPAVKGSEFYIPPTPSDSEDTTTNPRKHRKDADFNHHQFSRLF